MNETVELIAYDPEWPRFFEAEAERIKQILPGAILEHVGSTAVPGLAAKPFIDIVAGLEEDWGLAEAVAALRATSYTYVPEAEAVVPERRFFRRLDESPGYHLHVVARDAALWRNLPNFRDMLRASPEMAREYMQLKLELAESYRDDVDAYTLAKGPYIEQVLSAMRQDVREAPNPVEKQ